jgi:carboxyl-terminal processing protease
MEYKRRFWSLAAVLVAPILFAGTHSAQRGLDSPSRQKILDDFTQALLLAQDNYAGQVDYERLTKASILGMLHTLDPHSSYLDRKDWEAFQNEQRSRYSGIGSTIASRNGKVYIISPFDGTPAHRAGIRYGDQIVEVNGESTEGWTSQQVSSKLLGPEGTPVMVKVKRAGLGQPLEFKLVRATVPLPSVNSYFMVGKGIGYIRLQRGFNTTTYDEIRRAIQSLRQQGMTALILDLRDNRGGLVEQAWKVSNIFLYKGQKILSMRGRPSAFQAREYEAFNTSPDDYPLVVLINRATASAAEIVAGALQDHDRARIVGENSFGKGLVQTVFQLSDGSGLTLTTGKYYTPSGRLIQRDYSNRSFYDYYVRRGDSKKGSDERRTDAGRPVYGGGGIAPDVEVKFPQRELELQRLWLEPVFEFARLLVAGLIPGLEEFKIDHPADHHHRLQSDEYVITEKVMAAFRNFLREHKEFKIDGSRVEKDADFLRRQIRYEVVTAAYGQEVAYQVLLEGDVQMQQALAEIPKAKAMAEEIRRIWAASREGSLRR